MSTSPEPRRSVKYFVPGPQGGVGIVGLGLAADPQWRPAGLRFDFVETMQSLSPRGAVRFLAVAGSLLRNRGGDVALAHLNVSVRGSTIRKMVLASVCRLRGIPYVVQVHSGNYEPFYLRQSPWKQRRITGFMKGARRVIVLGNSMRSMTIQTIGVPADKVIVIPNAVVDPGLSAPKTLGPVTILHHGRLSAEKGTYDLLDALRQLDHDGVVGWNAVIAGDGDTDHLRDQVTEWGLGDRVEVHGWLDRQATIAALADADIYALPSHSEGLSLSLLEAMAAGLACVTTPVGAHVEVVADGEFGRLVPIGDPVQLAEALTGLVTDADERASIGAKARHRFLAVYEIGRLRTQLDGVYREVLGKSATAPSSLR